MAQMSNAMAWAIQGPLRGFIRVILGVGGLLQCEAPNGK